MSRKKSLLKWYPVPVMWLVVRDKYSVHVRSHALAQAAFGLFHFHWKHRCENGWSTTPRFISFPLRAFLSMILWRKRPERKDEVHEFPVWNVHKAHGRSTAVGRNAPSRTQTMDLMHHWQPCFRTVSAILIVLSTVVAKDAISSFHVQSDPSTDSLSSISLRILGWLKTCPEDLAKHAGAFLLSMAARWASFFFFFYLLG